jgi:hypothetical protein
MRPAAASRTCSANCSHPRPGVPYATVLAEAWDRITAPELRPYLRLFGQLHDLPPERTPWREFRVRSITDWLPVIEAGLRADVLRGLLGDLNTTADHERTTNALQAITKRLTPQSR